jgi:hypothetical protein
MESAGANLMNQAQCAQRENAQTIVANMVKQHERELAAWNYLQLVMAKEPPDATEEAALWELLGRARHGRY